VTFEELKRSARQSCYWRGHRMKPIRLTHKMSGHRRGAARCNFCPAWVNVLEHPAPNEIEIGGPAVAMNCPTDAKWC